MNSGNKLIQLNFPAGTTINTGVPNDSPTKLLSALSKYFPEHAAVSTVRLGLAEFIPPGGKSVFSYVIGIDGRGDLNPVIDDLNKIVLSSPMGRWPVIIVPIQKHQHLFTKQAIVVYQRQGH